MIVKDILPDHPIDVIEVRTNYPPAYNEPDGMLFGYCAWDGSELTPLDGDSYSVYDEIYRYEFDENGGLTYWLHSEWEDDRVRMAEEILFENRSM